MNYAEKLGTEECFFKVLPQNIGEIQYCRSTNPKAEKDSPKVRRKQYLMAIGIPVLIAGGLAAIFNNSPVFIGIECLAALIIIIKIVSKINSFKGEDFFVGTEGYARMSFDGDREDAKIIEEVLFLKRSTTIKTVSIKVPSLKNISMMPLTQMENVKFLLVGKALWIRQKKSTSL